MRKSGEIFHVVEKILTYVTFYIQATNLGAQLQGEEYKMNFHFNCNSDYVVYLLTCKICAKQYTGSPITSLDQDLISISRIYQTLRRRKEGFCTRKTN